MALPVRIRHYAQSHSSGMDDVQRSHACGCENQFHEIHRTTDET